MNDQQLEEAAIRMEENRRMRLGLHHHAYRGPRFGDMDRVLLEAEPGSTVPKQVADVLARALADIINNKEKGVTGVIEENGLRRAQAILKSYQTEFGNV